jgi:ATP-binding cassette subfamily B (MDR/TAP) protein 1
MSENKSPDLWKDDLKEDVERLALLMVILGAVTFVSYMLKSYLFSVLGENVTLEVRRLLYRSILEKNVGWFDE